MQSPRSAGIDEALLKFERQEIDGEELRNLLRSLNPEWYETSWFWCFFVIVVVLVGLLVLLFLKLRESDKIDEKETVSEKSTVLDKVSYQV